MTSWKESPVVAVGVLVLFVVIQLAIPISRLDSESTHRFGWQMFSVARPSPQFVVHTPTETIDIELSDYMGRVRADIDIAAYLPGHLCSVIPKAESITWENGNRQC